MGFVLCLLRFQLELFFAFLQCIQRGNSGFKYSLLFLMINMRFLGKKNLFFFV